MMTITVSQASSKSLGSSTSFVVAPALARCVTHSSKCVRCTSVAIVHLGVRTTAIRGPLGNGSSGTRSRCTGPLVSVASSRASGPMRHAANHAASATERANTPTVSSVGLNGLMPVREMAPKLGL